MKSKLHYTQAEADEIVLLIKEKLNADATRQKGIRAKIRNRGFWASEFGFKDGYTVADFLSVAKITGSKRTSPKIKNTENNKVSNSIKPIDKKSASRSHSDESYMIDLCDVVLNLKALRQHRFDFLRVDSGTKLPIDAFYPSLYLVIEFKEKQHTEAVKFFDKKQTVSGTGRGEQRKIYDQKRRDILPQNGIKLIELDYSDFEHTRGKKLVRNKEKDIEVIRQKLEFYL